MEPEIIRCPYGDPLEKEDRKLRLYDTTLRDGEQTLGVSFNRYKKLEIAQRLEEAGIPRIECGMPVASHEDALAVSMILNNVKQSEIFTLCRSMRSDVDLSLDLGVRNITCELPVSDMKLKAYNLTREKALERMMDTITYAKSQGMHVGFFGIDATRADPEFLKQTYTAAVKEAHADEVAIVDTIGVATPRAMENMVRLLQEWVGKDVPISTHCHEDMSTGVACTLAAFRAGASEAHVTVNGLGERCGNVDLAVLAVAARVLYGIDATVDYSKLCELSECVSRLSGVPVAGNRPVVGKNLFVRETGLTVAQMLQYPPAVEPFPPEMIGAVRDVALGKNSGKASIQFALEKHHLSLPDEKRAELLQAVKELGVKKSTSLTESEFMALYQKVANN